MILPGSVSGPRTYLTIEEEEELVIFLRRSASIDYAKSRKEVMALVQRIISCKGIDRTVSNGWWESFCRRHPNLTLRAPVPLSQARAVATDPDMLDSYFDLLEATMAENDLLDKPCHIFNVDETGLPLDSKAPKLIFERAERNPAAIGSGDKAQLTVIGCVSAAGVCLPPMVIWDRKTLSPELLLGKYLEQYMDCPIKDGSIKNYLIYGFQTTSFVTPHLPDPFCCFWMGIPHITCQRPFVKQLRSK